MKYKLSSNGARLITNYEELSLVSYLDKARVWTIGYGTTRLNGTEVSAGMVINEPVAWALFYGDCRDKLELLEKVVHIDLNQNQVDSLVSLTYNIGRGGFSSSNLLTAINSKLVINEDLFTRWNKVRNVAGQLVPSNGLTKRRKEEYSLYISKEGL